MTTQPQHAAFRIMLTLCPLLIDLMRDYTKEMEADGSSRQSINTARREIVGFIQWMAGERKQNSRIA